MTIYWSHEIISFIHRLGIVTLPMKVLSVYLPVSHPITRQTQQTENSFNYGELSPLCCIVCIRTDAYELIIPIKRVCHPVSCHKASSPPCVMSQAIVSQKELFPEVASAVVTDGINLFVFTCARLILFPATSDVT